MSVLDRIARALGLGGHPRGPGAGGAARRRPPPRSGFRFLGPLPGYSATTQRGNRVHVGGCCLPIPLAVLVTAAGSAVVVRRRRPGGGAG